MKSLSRFWLTIALIAGACSQPAPDAAAQQAPATSARSSSIDFSKSTPVDEAYRQRFVDCDQRNVFQGLRMSGFAKCDGDQNRLTRLVRFNVVQGLPGDAVAFTSKLGVDYDGSWVAAHTPGMTDQKDTSKEFPGPDGKNVPADSDTVAYIVVPNAGPREFAKVFARKTGVQFADVGVVIFQDHVVPVIVADGGPFNKIGEGSMALHRALGTELCRSRNSDGICTKVNSSPSSIGGGVTTIIFTRSAVPGVSAATVAQTTHDQALKLFDVFRQTYGGP
jgi:hypothetical protein